MAKQIYLTKTRYAAGVQCLRRLWLNVHEPAGWEEPGLGSIEDVGLEIGRMAHTLFPGGVLVEEAPLGACEGGDAHCCADGRPFGACDF
jgi:hypothetical protein